METELVWRALSSHHRRHLLDLMRDGPKTTGALCSATPGLTRFAVMQHLGVLEQAGLVLARREGRKRFNYSNPGLLREIYERWVSSLASSAAEATQHLRRYAEKQPEETTMENEQLRIVRIEIETRINAPRDTVYRAITEGFVNWWPHKFRPDGELFYENRIGGNYGEKWPDGGGFIFGTIASMQPGKSVKATGIGMFGDFTAANTETLEDSADGGTIYKKSLHLWGIVTPEVEKMLTEGSQALVEKALKGYCEAES